MEISSIADFFVKQTRFWIHGFGVDIKQAFKTEPDSEGMVSLRLGGYNIGTVAESQSVEAKESLLGFRKKLSSFSEYQEVARLLEELQKLAPEIQEELAVISLRRVVPGRCRYCPV